MDEIELIRQELEKLEAQKAQLDIQLVRQKEALKGRKAALEQDLERKKETRRKILVGSIVLKLSEQNDMQKESLYKMLDIYLVADRDRALFGLEPKNKEVAA